MSDEVYKGSIKSEKKNTVSKQGSKRYQIQFIQDRSFELKIGRRELRFTTDSKTAIINQEEFNHPDFKQQLRYFSVKEV